MGRFDNFIKELVEVLEPSDQIVHVDVKEKNDFTDRIQLFMQMLDFLFAGLKVVDAIFNSRALNRLDLVFELFINLDKGAKILAELKVALLYAGKP